MSDWDGFDLIVCPCNQVSDFPQKCPYHDQSRKLEDYGDWFDVNFRNKPVRAAWTCPRCDTVHAPHVDSCTCKPTTTTYTVTYPPYEPSTTYTATGTGQLSWIYCSHANECPMACPCSKDCICRKEGSCRSGK